MRTRTTRLASLTALLWIVSACAPQEAREPTVDAGAACLLSSSCPAGQYCDLQRCFVDCDATTPCADGQTCTPRGRCAATADDPGDAPAAAAPGVLTTDAQILHVTAAQQSVGISLHGAGRVRYRIESSAPWLMPSTERAAFETDTELTIPLDGSRRSADDTTATLHVVSTQGSLDIVVVSQPTLQGVWHGTVRFTQVHLDSGDVAAALGETRLSVFVRTDGEGLRAQLDPATSTLWPAAVSAAGTANPDGSVQFAFTSNFDASSAALYPATSASVFRAGTIGRELTLRLTLDDRGVLAGEAVERIHGLTSTAVELRGEAGFVRNPRGTLPEFSPAAPVTMPTGVVRGVGAAPGSSCTPGSHPSCDATAALGTRWSCLVDELLPQAYLLSNFYDPTNPVRVPVFSLPPTSMSSGSEYADVATACAAEVPLEPRSDTHLIPPGGGTACINLETLECARYMGGTLYADHPELSAQASLYVARASLELFALLGNEALVGAANERLSASASSTKIRTGLLSAHRSFDAGLYRFFNPKLFEELRAVPATIAQSGPMAPVVLNDRSPLRLAAKAVVSSDSAARRAFKFDLVTSSDVATMRARAQANAVLTWAQVALLVDLGARWGAGAQGAAELSSLGALVNTIDGDVAAITADATPLGIARTYVPLLARTSSADVQTNFERIFAIAQTSVAASVQADAVATADERAFDQSAALIEQTLIDDLIEVTGTLQALCGNDFIDANGAPASDLTRCGVNGGTVRDAVLGVGSAQLQVQSAYQALSDQYAIVDARTEAYARVKGVQKAQIAFVNKENKQILNLNIAQASMQAVADMLSAGASAADSFYEGHAAAGGLHIAAGAAQATADLLGPAQLKLQQMIDVKGLEVDQEITDITNNEDLFEQSLQFVQLNIQVALQANELSRALNTQLSQREQVVSNLGTYDTDVAALARVTLLGSDPSFRIIQSADALAADAALMQGKRDLYLAARALEYETNTSLDDLTQAIFLAQTGAQLDALQRCLANAWTQWRLLVSSTNSYVTEVSLAADVLGISGPVTDAATGQVISTGEQFRRHFFSEPYAADALHVWPALRFGTTLSQTGLFSSLVCNDRIQAVEAKLVGPSLRSGRGEVQLLADGASQMRSCTASDTETQVLAWNLRPRGQAAPALLSAGVNDYDTASSPNQSLLDYAVSQDSFILALPDANTSPANAGLDVSRLDDVVLRITHTGVARGSASSTFHPTCN